MLAFKPSVGRLQSVQPQRLGIEYGTRWEKDRQESQCYLYSNHLYPRLKGNKTAAILGGPPTPAYKYTRLGLCDSEMCSL